MVQRCVFFFNKIKIQIPYIYSRAIPYRNILYGDKTCLFFLLLFFFKLALKDDILFFTNQYCRKKYIFGLEREDFGNLLCKCITWVPVQAGLLIFCGCLLFVVVDFTHMCLALSEAGRLQLFSHLSITLVAKK